MSTDLTTILKLNVPVIVNIGCSSIPTSDILTLGPGAILELDKPADEPLDLWVNNKPIGTGTAVKVGENFGIRILNIGSTHERIQAMGTQKPV